MQKLELMSIIELDRERRWFKMKYKKNKYIFKNK